MQESGGVILAKSSCLEGPPSTIQESWGVIPAQTGSLLGRVGVMWGYVEVVRTILYIVAHTCKLPYHSVL